MRTGSTLKQGGSARGLSAWLVGMCLTVLIGFLLRLSFYVGQVYYIDEFTSMLAATMVAQRGLPIFPSGLFYDHGLLFSFISGVFVALLGFSEEVARWPTLLVSVLTIAAYYMAARQLFDSRATGLLAAVIVTLDSLSIMWGARARMYALAHLFVLLSVVWLLKSTLKQPSRRGRYLFLLFLAGALFSHTVSFIMVPVLVILLFIVTLVYRREWLRSSRLWQEAVVAFSVLGVALVVVSMGQTGSTVSLQDFTSDASSPLGLEFLRGFFLLGLEWPRFDGLVGFFVTPAYKWFLLAIIVSLVATCYRVIRHTTTFADVAFLFLALFVTVVVVEMGGLLGDHWRKTRYLFILTMPVFFLLAAESLTRLLQGLAHLVTSLSGDSFSRKWARIMVPVVGIVIVGGVWGPAAWDISDTRGTGNYNTAFAFVNENWQPGDRVMTIHPSAAYLYLGRCDFYANQVTAKVLSEDEDETAGSLIDRYTGSPLIDSVEEFNAALSEGHRTWFVVDRSRLYRRYGPFFTQQILAQMDLAHHTGGVLVFLSRPYPQPVPLEPSVALKANFNDLIELAGYSLDLGAIAPDGTVQLGLYWRPLAGHFTRVYKVFVQLRDEQDQIIAQADHYIYEDLLTGSIVEQLRDQTEWVRDTADLTLPQVLPSGPYRLVVGLYDPDTLERVPVVADQSGENAVILETVTVP